jgi:hypothetical protein
MLEDEFEIGHERLVSIACHSPTASYDNANYHQAEDKDSQFDLERQEEPTNHGKVTEGHHAQSERQGGEGEEVDRNHSFCFQGHRLPLIGFILFIYKVDLEFIR